jgi:hypothetical protein
MTPQQVFSITNAVALLAWIMLAVLPGRPWVTKTVTTKFVPLLFAVLYTAIAISLFGRAPGGFSTLAAVATLFSNPWLLLAGWVHYLAFDLLVGSWELQDARERGIPHLLVVPCLALTFLFGPAGWLLYTVVRSIRRTGSTTISSRG